MVGDRIEEEKPDLESSWYDCYSKLQTRGNRERKIWVVKVLEMRS